MLAATKAAKPGNVGSKDDDDNDEEEGQKGVKTSEVENKTILMGHPISCCHAPVVRSFSSIVR